MLGRSSEKDATFTKERSLTNNAIANSLNVNFLERASHRFNFVVKAIISTQAAVIELF